MGNEVTLGQYAVPVILSVILGLIYKTVGAIPNRWKPLISVLCGVALGFVALVYSESLWDAKHMIDAVLYGLMTGAAAVGLYELQKAGRG